VQTLRFNMNPPHTSRTDPQPILHDPLGCFFQLLTIIPPNPCLCPLTCHPPSPHPKPLVHPQSSTMRLRLRGRRSPVATRIAPHSPSSFPILPHPSALCLPPLVFPFRDFRGLSRVSRSKNPSALRPLLHACCLLYSVSCTLSSVFCFLTFVFFAPQSVQYSRYFPISPP
jgi:hypothetical protein